MLYAHGQRLGEWSEAEETFAELAMSVTIESRDENGNDIVKAVPRKEPIIPWDPTVTRAQLDRESAEGGIPLKDF